MTHKHPKLIILTGRPAAGKSTIGKRLPQDIKLPIIGKDEIREVLLDYLGCKDRPWAPSAFISISVLQLCTLA